MPTTTEALTSHECERGTIASELTLTGPAAEGIAVGVAAVFA